MGLVQKVGGTRAFIEESWDELRKVTWPDYEQLKSATTVVIVFCMMVAAIIWIMDTTIRSLVGIIMSTFGA